MLIFVMRYLFLFITGAVMGWGLEVVYRRYFGAARKWINPGFLSGPFLPLYGTGVSLLYIVSDFQIDLWAKVVLFAVVTTTIEYVTGEFFLRYYKTRLWDYSSLKFNYRGIVAPLYSFFWTLLSLFFYYVLYPHFYNQIEFLYKNLEFSLFIGIVIGMVIVDMINSFDIINRVKSFAETREDHVIVDYEQLKLEIRDRIDNISGKVEHLSDGFTGRVEHMSEGIESRMHDARHSFRRRRPTFFRPFNGSFEMLTQLREHIDLKSISEKRKKGEKDVN